MTYVRVTRDQRGYETIYLLHMPRPGDRARVLYWYRTAPSIRVGRPALDEEAIRTIEEQHPEIEFDWHQLLDELSAAPPEVERRPERPRRKAQRPKDVETAAPPEPAAAAADAPAEAHVDAVPDEPSSMRAAPPPLEPVRDEPARVANPLLDQLVGREIATRLRARYAEVTARLRTLPEDATRAAWQARADALDPDRWSTPEAILNGIQNADPLFDELKRELP